MPASYETDASRRALAAMEEAEQRRTDALNLKRTRAKASKDG
jgi:hypothetical protein